MSIALLIAVVSKITLRLEPAPRVFPETLGIVTVAVYLAQEVVIEWTVDPVSTAAEPPDPNS